MRHGQLAKQLRQALRKCSAAVTWMVTWKEDKLIEGVLEKLVSFRSEVGTLLGILSLFVKSITKVKHNLRLFGLVEGHIMMVYVAEEVHIDSYG